MRAAMHQAGAIALSQLLRCEPPGLDKREIPCPCGQKARFGGMRSRHVLTAVGKVEILRPWYLCRQCHNGQFPADAALDIDRTDLSPGVRRMLALVGPKRRSTVAASRFNCLPGWKSPPNPWKEQLRALAKILPGGSGKK